MSFVSLSEVGSLLNGLSTCEDGRKAMDGGVGGTALVEQTARDLTVDAGLDLTCLT